LKRDFEELVWRQIQQITMDAVGSIADEVAAALKQLRQDDVFRGTSFQLFGFDILIDSEYKAWLCEVCSFH
jgi:hypothetical protein